MTLPDDTQPRSPFKTPARAQRPVVVEPELMDEPAGGPGCFVWGLVGVVVLGFALVIIVLAGLAGWTSGQRIAQNNATATQYAAINDQINRLPVDLNGGNFIMAQARIQWLMTQTPGVPNLTSYMQTATAAFQASLPTATLPPTAAPTDTPPPTTEATAQAAPAANPTEGSLAALLQQAQGEVTTQDWGAAIDTLQIIVSTDSTYQSSTVRGLMLQALLKRAQFLFRNGNNGDLAEAIRLFDRAKEFGDASELNYEAYVAGLYLDAISAVGVSYPVAIQRLQRVYNEAPQYRDVGQLLVNQYIAYGDAFVAGGEYCPAVGPYQSALSLQNSAAVASKRDNAQTMCQQATPIGGETPGGPIAPIGVPGS
jgi:tetratricopeptide (TPR) repeat protein